MKIYVSLPIGNHEKTVRQRYDNAVKDIEILCHNAVIIGPVNIGEFDDNGIKHERTHDWAWYMDKDIEILSKCDAIWMTQGWKNSDGCRVEHSIAKHFHLKVMFGKNADNDLEDE